MPLDHSLPPTRGRTARNAEGRAHLNASYDTEGVRRRKSSFASKSAALIHYRDVIEPQLRGEPVAAPDLTLAEFVPTYLERHAATVRPPTIATLTKRLTHATRAFGTVPLRDLEHMSGEIAAWQARLPERSRYGIVQALRQTLGAAVRWGHLTHKPAKQAGRPQSSRRGTRTYTRAELDARRL